MLKRWRNDCGEVEIRFRDHQLRRIEGEVDRHCRRGTEKSFPTVLVAQSMVGREGLNLHQACRVVVLLHPEWNPGVVEQQIGRVDRIGSRWSKDLDKSIENGSELPRIEVRPSCALGGANCEHSYTA